MNTLAQYLHGKHLQYCNEKGRIVNESEWVLDVLNRELPPGDKLSNGSVNQWMNGGRNPDAKNVVRLIHVFGPEVMPYLGIKFAGELGDVVAKWDDLSEEEKTTIHNIAMKDPELEPMQIES